MMRWMLVAVIGYFAFEYVWDYIFEQDRDEIASAFRTTKDEDGNIVHNLTKVVILYCYNCGNGATYEKIKNLIETQAPEIELTGIRHM